MDAFILSMIVLALGIAIFIYYRNKKQPSIKDHPAYTKDDLYNSLRREKEIEIDRLLSKMGDDGIHGLSAKDKARLEELSKK